DRILQLLRGADQHSGAGSVPLSLDQTLAARAPAPQPEGSNKLGADNAIGHGMDSISAHPAPMAAGPLRRQTPKVGAVCPNRARTVLCGGRSAMSVPTVIKMWLLSRGSFCKPVSSQWLRFFNFGTILVRQRRRQAAGFENSTAAPRRAPSQYNGKQCVE